MNNPAGPSQIELKKSAEEIFATGNAEAVTKKLLEACFNIEDQSWVLLKCEELAQAEDLWVAKTAITCIGHSARIHKKIDSGIVLRIFKKSQNRKELAGSWENCADDIEVYVRDQSLIDQLRSDLAKG